MDRPIIYDNIPISLDLDVDQKYLYCTCGKSTKGGLCDGSHKNSGFKPLIFSPEKTRSHDICQCKQTKNPPYCDGSHSDISDEDVGSTGS